MEVHDGIVGEGLNFGLVKNVKAIEGFPGIGDCNCRLNGAVYRLLVVVTQ